MSSEKSETVINLENVVSRILNTEERAERVHGSVTLVAVSKTKPAVAIQELYDAGHRIFGENYAQELVEKAADLPKDIDWHYIGTLQSKKAKTLVRDVPNLKCIETVDSEKLAMKINNACESCGRSQPLDIFIQIDTSGEDTKSGIPASEATSLATFIREKCPFLKFKGVMTIGAPGDLSCFDRLKECRNDIASFFHIDPDDLALSMGMSGDFEEAIERGATHVRVGSTIFGARDYSMK